MPALFREWECNNLNKEKPIQNVYKTNQLYYLTCCST